MSDPFPPVGEQPWELRFTRRGLDDIGAGRIATRVLEIASFAS